MIQEREGHRDYLFAVGKFPQLSNQIKRGDFKLLILMEDGRSDRKIARFPNTSIFKPDGTLVQYLLLTFFLDIRPEDILYQSYGLVGLEITTK